VSTNRHDNERSEESEKGHQISSTALGTRSEKSSLTSMNSMDEISTERALSTICLSISSTPPNDRAILHLLPCKIDKSGPAPVSEYFQATPSSCAEGFLTSHFRGREVTGKVIALTGSTRGIINLLLYV
jgi:hypothetical protein